MANGKNNLKFSRTGSNKLGLTFSYDAGWQRRGSGNSYGSYSSHATLHGAFGKGVCSYTTRSKNCRKCAAGQKKESHKCVNNYEGSSKAMEADMAVELFTQNDLLKKHAVFGARLIMDNDSSTIASLREVSEHPIELWADTNHTIKGFTGALYSLSLPKNLIDYFKSFLSNSISEHKNKPEDLALNLKMIVPHVFGDHSICLFHEDKENYQYKTLPGNKPLESESLKSSLTELIAQFSQNVNKIAPGGSTQANESFNHIVASKCPKSKHYSGSESMNF